MNGLVQGAYAQVLGLGLLWTSVHCAGMCGPLLVSLDVAGVRHGRGAVGGAGQVLAYQAGRALTYAWLGGLSGALGAGLGRGFASAGALLAVLLGAPTLLLALRALVQRRAPALVSLGKTATQSRFAALARHLPTLRAGESALNSAVLGAVMGFLPCMVALWVLGLAAVTRSPLHGAALMVLLVALTTPMLLGVTLLPRLRVPRRARVWLPPLLQCVSGAWLMLIGLSGAGLIQHGHAGFTLLKRGFTVMFY